MDEQGLILEEASFRFSQDGNCISDPDEFEFLEIEARSSLGIDRDGDCFFVLKTEKWSINDEQDLKKLFDRIKKVVLNGKE